MPYSDTRKQEKVAFITKLMQSFRQWPHSIQMKAVQPLAKRHAAFG